MLVFKVITGILFSLLISAIIVLGIISYQKSDEMNSASSLAKTARITIGQIQEIAWICKDLQLESQSFFISGDSLLDKSYRKTRNRLPEEINRLRNLAQGKQSQLERIDSLEIQALSLVKFTDSIMASAGADSPSGQDIQTIIETCRGFRKNINHILNNIKDEENELLIVREQANEASMLAFNRNFNMLLTGTFILLIFTFFSIKYHFTKRAKAQLELQKANDLFKNLFNESPVGKFLYEVGKGSIIDCNKAFKNLINLDREAVIGQSLFKLDIFNDEMELKEIIKLALGNETLREIELQMRPKGKEPVWVMVSVQTIQIQNTKCFLFAILDITAHKRAEEEIKKALEAEVELNKMKSNFITLASHEFRTPLTTIKSSAFLLENLLDGACHGKVEKHISKIKGSVNTLTSILNEFLSLTKIEEGKVDPKFEWLNLKDYLENVCSGLKSFTKEGQTIDYLHDGKEYFYTDPVLLGNIVNNLISNAIKYSPEHTKIQLSSAINGQLHLSVKDAGIGIPKEDQQRLFERFFRASNSGNVQGTGLGLHILKHYVDLLKGTINVSSESGKGTEFDLLFEETKPAQLAISN